MLRRLNSFRLPPGCGPLRMRPLPEGSINKDHMKKTIDHTRQRYSLETWPDSQGCVGKPGCVLVCPPETDVDPTALDSAYLVPESDKDPLPAGGTGVYVRIPWPDSQPWNDMELKDADDILHDYDTQDAYVRESFYLKVPKPKSRRMHSYEVTFRVHDGWQHNDPKGFSEVIRIIRAENKDDAWWKAYEMTRDPEGNGIAKDSVSVRKKDIRRLPDKPLKRFEVTLYYHTNATVEVKARDEEEARGKAYAKIGGKGHVRMLLDGMQEDDSPDVREL